MTDKLYLTFENYLSNEMSAEDKVIFEKKLAENPEFIAAFNLYKETTDFAELKFSGASKGFKDNLKNISTNHFATTKPKKSRIVQLRPIFYAVAAVLVLLFGLQLFQNDPSFEDFNQFGNAAIGERGSMVPTDLKKAEKAFNEKKYKEATPLFDSVLRQNKTDEVSYLYGIALLQEDRTSEAEKIFYNLKKENKLYADNATWCLALAKLKAKDYAACKALILEISEDADYYEASRKLLNDLD